MRTFLALALLATLSLTLSAPSATAEPGGRCMYERWDTDCSYSCPDRATWCWCPLWLWNTCSVRVALLHDRPSELPLLPPVPEPVQDIMQ